MQIGVIAEDQSDYDALRGIVLKIKTRTYSFKKMLGKGNGKIVSKCNAWSKVLRDRGCTHLIILRDSDGGDVKVLRKQISRALHPCSIDKNIIVIAVEELEGWLLADKKAIHKVFSSSNDFPNEVASPELIKSPKEHIASFVKREYNKTYLNTAHNIRIVKHIDVRKIRNKCPSFSELYDFIS